MEHTMTFNGKSITFYVLGYGHINWGDGIENLTESEMNELLDDIDFPSLFAEEVGFYLSASEEWEMIKDKYEGTLKEDVGELENLFKNKKSKGAKLSDTVTVYRQNDSQLSFMGDCNVALVNCRLNDSSSVADCIIEGLKKLYMMKIVSRMSNLDTDYIWSNFNWR